MSSGVIPLLPFHRQTEWDSENDSWLLIRSILDLYAGTSPVGYVLNDIQKELLVLYAYAGCISNPYWGGTQVPCFPREGNTGT